MGYPHAHSQKQRKRERGSVLWIILITLALIAALTAVLTRSGSSVDQTADVEQQSIKINQMLRYTKGLQTAIEQMKLNGISESDLNFSSTAANSANCSRSDCKLFDVGGGGLTHQMPPQGISSAADWRYIATNNVMNVGTNAPDLILFLDQVNEGYCNLINRQLRITKGAADSGIDLTDFAGTFSAEETIDNAGGHEAGCQSITEGGTTRNFFYQVLIVR